MKDWKEVMETDSSNTDTTNIMEGMEEANADKKNKKEV